MTDLIARLTAATGPDVELDAAIEMALNPGATGLVVGLMNPVQIAAGERVKPPTYTRSIDNALTAVPDGWRLRFLERRSSGFWEAGIEVIEEEDELSRIAASAPLAICIAAMKARGV